jgi:hypothetical protein
MVGQLGELVVSLSADLARFQSDMGKAVKIAEDKSKTMSNALSKVGLALGAGISVGGLVAVAKHSLEVSDNISKASQKIGIATETLSSLSYAAQLADVDFQALTSGMGKFNKNIVEGATGSAKQAEAFKLLGISQKELQTNSPDELFAKVSERFAQMEDGAGKTTLAMTLFGKAGADLIPLLNEGAEGLADARVEAERLGLVLSTDTGKKAEEFNDNLTRMKNGLAGVANQVMVQNLPMMVKLSDALVATAKDGDAVKKASDTIAAGLKLIASAGAVAAGVFSYVGERIASVAAAMTFAAEGEFKKAWQVLGDGSDDAEKNLSGIAKRIEAIWDTTAKQVEAKAPENSKKIAAPFIGAAEEAKKSADKIKKEADAIAKHIKEIEEASVKMLELGDVEISVAGMGFDWAKNKGKENLQIAQPNFSVDTGMIPDWAKKKSGFDLNGNSETALFGGSSVIEAKADENEELLKMQKDFDTQMLASKMDYMEQSTSLAKNAFAGNKGMMLAALAIEKAIAISRILMNTEIAASAAIAAAAAIPFGGAAIGAAQAAAIRSSGYMSIGMVVASGAMEAVNIAGQRAGGGPVSRGSTYLVGEKGPELFTPGQSGMITPNGAGGGGLVVNATIDARGADAGVEQRIRAGMKQAIEMAYAKVKRSMDRGGEMALASGRV